MRFLNWSRKCIYDYEFNKVLNHKITEPTYGTYVSDVHIGIFSPILVVTKTLDNYFGFERYMRLNIHGIDVDTQKEIIEITFRIYRPGLLIGKEGKDIDEICNRLEVAFNKRVHININEVRKDINKPRSYF
jgi:ribosomal protein S3